MADFERDLITHEHCIDLHTGLGAVDMDDTKMASLLAPFHAYAHAYYEHYKDELFDSNLLPTADVNAARSASYSAYHSMRDIFREQVADENVELDGHQVHAWASALQHKVYESVRNDCRFEA